MPYSERILQLARRHNAPLIVASETEEEPLVVIRLSLYEAFLSEKGSNLTQSAVALSRSIQPDDELPVIEFVKSKQDHRDAEDVSLASIEAKIVEETPTGAISIEEQFYLEPIDEITKNG